MPLYTSAATGLWSAPATWSPVAPAGGPTLGDRVIIASPHVVTCDVGVRTIGDDTGNAITVNAGGTLFFPRASATTLTVRGGVSVSGTWDMGTEADRITAACEIRLNDSAVLAVNKYQFTKNAGGQVFAAGVVRTRRTTLTAPAASGATSIQVAAATGWQPNDLLLLIPTAESATPATGIQRVQIDPGYSGGLTVPLAAANAVARASGGYVANLSSNVRITQANDSFGTSFNSFTDNVVNGVVLSHVEFDWTGAGAAGSLRFGLNPVAGGYQARIVGCAAWQPVAANVTYSRGQLGSLWSDYVQHTLGNGTQINRFGCDIDGALLVTNGTAAESTGVNNLPARSGFSRNVAAFSASPTQPVNAVFSYYGATTAAVYGLLNNAAGSVGVMQITAPGYVYRSSDFAYTATARPLFNLPTETSGTTQFIGCRVPDTEPTYTFGSAPGLQAILIDCFKRGTPSDIFTRMYADAGIVDSVTTLRLNSPRSYAATQGVTGLPIEYSFTRNIGPGESRTLAVNIRRDVTYGAGSMPSVSMEIVGLPVVTTAAPDVADTWHRQIITITNTLPTSQEVVVTLRSGGTVNGVAYFSGLPVLPFVQLARWYGYVFDETNPFRAVDSTITIPEATVAAYTGISVNHGTQTITITAPFTNQQVYSYLIWDLCQAANNQRTKHVTSSDGIDFTTTYTISFSGAGAISGGYADANGRVVGVTVSGIVPGSRIMIRRTDTNVVMLNTLVAGTTAGFSVAATSPIPIAVEVRKASAAPFYQPWSTTGFIDPTAGFAATANQQPD